MAEIEEITEPLKKLSKNKKALVFAGVGIAAGVVVLLMRKTGSSAATPAVAVPIGSAVSQGATDQTASALMSQVQSFEQSVNSSQTALAGQVSAMNDTVNGITANDQAFQKSISDNQASIVSQLASMQYNTDHVTPATQSPTYSAPVNPIQQAPIVTHTPTSYVSGPVNQSTVNVAPSGVVSTATPIAALPSNLASSYPGAFNVFKTDNGYTFNTPGGGFTRYVG